MNRIVIAIALLFVSNTFMTFAWYAHLRDMAHKPWLIAALVSWVIALCEYLFQVPANRIGYTELSLPQLKIIQEVIALTVFVPFAMLYMRQAWSWNYLWAALCLLGAVFFIFRDSAKIIDVSEVDEVVEGQGVERGKKVVDHNADATLDSLQTARRWRFGDIAEACDQKEDR